MDVSRKICLTVVILLTATAVLCYAQNQKPDEKKSEEKSDIWKESEGGPGKPEGRGGPEGPPGGPGFFEPPREPEGGRGGRGRPRFFELSDEMIKRVLDSIAKKDPAKAKELAKLREKDPNQFEVELRTSGREEFGKIFREQMESMRQKWQAEYIEWLEKNVPQEAEDLKKHKDKDPEVYSKRLELSIRRYGEIFRASRENPELAVILKEDMRLRDKADELLKKIKAAQAEEEKKKLMAELQEVVSDRFDLIVRQKELEYERLLRRLEELKKEVEKNKAEITKWKDPKVKDENVKKRIEDLLKGLLKFKWD
jgi:hypothetical protein